MLFFRSQDCFSAYPAERHARTVPISCITVSHTCKTDDDSPAIISHRWETDSDALYAPLPPRLPVLPVLFLPQRWYPLSPPAHKTEDEQFGAGPEDNSGSGGGGSDGRTWATAMEQRRATDFAHYNPIIQVELFLLAFFYVSGLVLNNSRSLRLSLSIRNVSAKWHSLKLGNYNRVGSGV